MCATDQVGARIAPVSRHIRAGSDSIRSGWITPPPDAGAYRLAGCGGPGISARSCDRRGVVGVRSFGAGAIRSNGGQTPLAFHQWAQIADCTDWLRRHGGKDSAAHGAGDSGRHYVGSGQKQTTDAGLWHE